MLTAALAPAAIAVAVPCRARSGPGSGPAPDRAPTLHQAAVAGEWRDPDQRGDGSAVELPSSGRRPSSVATVSSIPLLLWCARGA
jgi:hypothetical protein